MKKLFLFAASTLMMLGSCSQDEMMNAPQSNEDDKMAIVASIEGQPNSRVTESQGTLSWEADDWFTVFSDNGVKFTTDATNAPLGKFTPEEDVTPDDNSYAVYYPVNNAFSLTNAELTVNLAASYSSGASIKAPMWGTYADGSISFKHLCGALKVAYSEIPTGYTTLVVEASKPINGTFTATLSAGEPVLATTAQASETNKKVTVTITEGENGVFYVPLPADTYDLKVYALKGNDIIELKSWSNLTIARKGLYQTTATYVAVSQSLSTPAAVSSAIANIGDNSVVDIEGTIDATTSEAGNMTLPDKNATYNFAETPTTTEEKPLTFVEADGSDGAKVNINMPSGATGLHAVINTPNSTVNIDGGTYESLTATTAENTLIIGKGVTIKSLNIKGGNVILMGNVENIQSEKATTITLGSDIIVSANTVIGSNVTVDGANFKVSTNTTVGSAGKGKCVFVLTGGTIKNVEFTSPNTQYDIIVKAGGSVITDCKFATASTVTNAAGTTTYGKRAIYTGSSVELTGTLTVKNCIFDDKVYAFNFLSGKNKMDVTFEKCTLGGWLSGTGKTHTFTDCTFTKSGDYANYIPYCPATFNGCSFVDGFTISLKHGSTFTFDKNCKYNEAAVTEPEDLKWDFSGDGTDNGTKETLTIGTTIWENTGTETATWN